MSIERLVNISVLSLLILADFHDTLHWLVANEEKEQYVVFSCHHRRQCLERCQERINKRKMKRDGAFIFIKVLKKRFPRDTTIRYATKATSLTLSEVRTWALRIHFYMLNGREKGKINR